MLRSALAAVDALAQDAAAIVLDYDGTLTPIVDRPEDAVLDPATRAVLAGLRERVTILSGRGLADVRERVGLDGLIYAGCHGLEVAGPGLAFEHEAAQALRPHLAALASELAGALASIPGVLVEDKGLAVAVHYRLVPDDRHEHVAQVVAELTGAYPNLRRRGGKRVHEILPEVPWDKGRALRWIVGRLGVERAIYLGDDVTDEDAFTAIVGLGTGVLVAAEQRPTAASYWLRDPDEVRALLQRLLEREGA